MKRIFITGASSGIGLATAKLLVERGDEVWGTSRDVARLPQLPHLHPVRLDLSDNVSLGESFRGALREAGHFDVVINNAGSGHFGPGELLSAEAVQAQFQTLVFAHIELCRLSLASMRAHGCGRIINVTSLASRMPVPFMAAYNAAKAAMASFTMSLQLELAGSDVRVTALHHPSGTRYEARTRTDGRVLIPGMRVGGPYRVSTTALGYGQQVKDNVIIRLGEATDLDFVIRQPLSSARLTELVIAIPRPATRDGPSQPQRDSAGVSTAGVDQRRLLSDIVGQERRRATHRGLH